MIRKPTVLVLGAGASRPYGFPTAYEMVVATEREIVDPVALSPTLLKAGCSSSALAAFPPLCVSDPACPVVVEEPDSLTF